MVIVTPVDWRSKCTLSTLLVDPSKTDLPKMFHIMYMTQIPVISGTANQTLSHKMQQTNGVRMVLIKMTDTSVKPALDTTTEEAILLFSSLQCSCYSQKRLICAVMTTVLKSIAKFRVLPPSWREVQKWTENCAFSAHYLQILLSLQITLRSVKMLTPQLTLQSPLESCSSCTCLVSARTQTSMKLGKNYPAIFCTCCWTVQKHH